jgi:hypothetical protein
MYRGIIIKVMKKVVQKLALVWIAILSFIGLAKAKDQKPEQENRNKVSRHRVVMLDEHEYSAYHSN